MIPVIKPTTIPAGLVSKGNKENSKNQASFDADPSLHKTKGFKIKSSIYGEKNVKAILKKAQHNKCCFCEKGQVDEWGAVEHYRPKSAFRKSASQPIEYPGYYWLAYDWGNLYFVCSACNSEFKRELFPIKVENRRARNHHDDVLNESALIVNPGAEDPRKHIRFYEEVIVPKSTRGKVSIEILGLDRSNLEDLRRDCLALIKSFVAIYKETQNLTKPEMQLLFKDAKKYLKDSIKPSAQYSSMAIDYLESIGVLAEL